MTTLGIKITKLLLAASIAALALSASPAASAQNGRDQGGNQIGRTQMTVEFRYKSWESASQNYQQIRRLVKRACTTPGSKLAVTRLSEQVCVDGMTDLFVAQLGRPQIADAHFAATGRRIATDHQLASAGR